MQTVRVRRRRRIIPFGVLAAVAIATSGFLTRNIDFRVYWQGTKDAFDGLRPFYGPASGLGFPMHYRYPPVTYLLFRPLSQIPLYWAGVLWALGAWAAASSLVMLAIHTAHLRFTSKAVFSACVYLLPYVVMAVHSGNVQPYLIAMIFAALILSESHRIAAAALLGLAITFKVWPLFFLPWFLHRDRRLVLAWLVPTMLFLWLLPLTVWSPSTYLDLLHQWYCSEFHSAIITSEGWYFPGQSLRSVLLRYLTATRPWIRDFPAVHVLTLSPQAVVLAWEVIAFVLYAISCIAMLHTSSRKRWIWDGLSFSLFTVLEPFCLKSGMISLGPAVLVAAALYSRCCRAGTSAESVARRLFLGASALSFLGAAMQYKPLLWLFLALGIDFYAAVLLLGALLVWVSSIDSDQEACIRQGSVDLGVRLLEDRD